jgi:hypothetical protein
MAEEAHRRREGMTAMDYFHIGFVVADLDQAMDEFGACLGLTWRPVMSASLELVDGDGKTESVTSRFAYSAGGPPAIELIQAVPGTIFESSGSPFHHIGYWADDLVTQSAQLVERGCPLGGTLAGQDGRPSRFALHRAPWGFNVELVDRWFDRPWLRDLLPRAEAGVLPDDAAPR